MSKNKEKPLILVVDDDERILRSFKWMLEVEGFRVVTANNGEVALQQFEKEAPDLVLLDIMMPEMDGYRVCQCIRDFSQVPIIIVSARSHHNEKVKLLLNVILQDEKEHHTILKKVLKLLIEGETMTEEWWDVLGVERVPRW